MLRSKVTPPSARVPLLVLLAALAAGALMFLRLHRGLTGVPTHAPRPLAAVPVPASPVGNGTASR